MARIAALFRRLDALQKPQSAEGRISRGDLEIDMDRMLVLWRDLECSSPGCQRQSESRQRVFTSLILLAGKIEVSR